MKFCQLILVTFIVNTICSSNAYAVLVDFEAQYTGPTAPTTIESTFIAADPSDPIQNTSSPLIEFAGGAVNFSGGVILRDPLSAMATPIIGDGGSIYYGSAFSPTTSIGTTGYVNPITIDIDPNANFSSVSGVLINGLNTNAPENEAMVLASYVVSFFNGATLLGTDSTGDVPFTDGATTISFGFDTSSLMGALMGAAITQVLITAADVDLDSTDMIVQNEFDFLLASVSFDGGMSPVPLPAALPLFISAMLGGFFIARPKKSSDKNIG